MSIIEYAFSWLVDSTIATALVLGVGGAGMLFSVQPAVRQRIAEWTLSSTLMMIALLALPVVARYELGILPMDSADSSKPSGNDPNTVVLTRDQVVDGQASLSVNPTRPLVSVTNESTGNRYTDKTFTDNSLPLPPVPANEDDSTTVSLIRSQYLGWRTWAVLAYLCGVIVFGGWLFLGYVGLVRMLRSAHAPCADVQDLWSGLLTEKTACARLLVSPVTVQPMTFGIRRSIVLIPATLCRPEFRGLLRLILQHELVHVERRDALSWTFANAARTILFHQPAYWWIRRQLRDSQEYVADSWAAEEAESVADYAQVLTDFAKVVNRRHGIVGGGIGIVQSRSELYRRIKMLSCTRPLFDKWCGTRLNFQAGFCAVGVVICLSSLTFRTTAQIDNPLEANTRSSTNSDATGTSDSRLWHILRQPNTMGLFHGLPQRMEPFSTTTSGTGEIWEGTKDGGALRLHLEVESDSTDDVFVGFFEDPKWWVAPPVQVRRFPGAGEFTVSGLPHGTYYVGAIMGSLPRPDALGIECTWPHGITIQSPDTAVAHMLVTEEFDWLDTTRNPRHYAGDWPKFDPSRLVTVQTIASTGEPIPYCRVNYSITSGGIASSFGTDQEGYTYRDDIRGTFSVSATRNSFDPVTLAKRYHTKRFFKMHDAANRPVIQVVWEPFPSGTGTVSGKVHDQFGNPLKEFHVQIVNGHDGPDSPESFGQRIPIIDPAGRFEVHGLAPGNYTVTAMAFDYPTHVYQEHDELKRFAIGQSPNETVHLEIELQARELRYARAIYEDGTPVKAGSWSGPSGSFGIEPDGRFRVSLSREERQRLSSLEKGEIKVQARGQKNSQSSVVTVAWSDLSEDASQPFTVVFPRPEPNHAQRDDGRTQDSEDDPAVIRRLKQIGATFKTRDNGGVQEIVFLDARLSASDAILIRKLPNVEKLRFIRTAVDDATLTLIKELPHLLELEIPNASISDWGVGQLTELSTLRSLDIRHTGLTDDGLRDIATLTHLETLDISETKVTDAGMEHIVGFKKLKRLNLQGTAVTDEGLRNVGRIKTLEELNLFGLPITDEGLERIAGLQRLEDLDLHGSKVTDAGLTLLSQIKSIKALNLGDTSITDAGVGTVASWSLLERLNLSRTRVTDASVDKLKSLENLRVLYIEPNLSDAALPQLTSFPHLQVLGVGGPNITDAGMEHIAQLTGLTNLYLQKSNITDASVPHLIRLRKLLLLSLSGTHITPKGMNQFYDSFSRPPQVFGP